MRKLKQVAKPIKDQLLENIRDMISGMDTAPWYPNYSSDAANFTIDRPGNSITVSRKPGAVRGLYERDEEFLTHGANDLRALFQEVARLRHLLNYS